MINYAEATGRHLSDAGVLQNVGRNENADQLYGIAAECALKAVMVCFGLPIDAHGNVERPYRTHNPAVWRQYMTFCANRISNRYPISDDPFHDWDVNQRYHAGGGVSSASVVAHSVAAKAAARLIDEVRLDGYQI